MPNSGIIQDIQALEASTYRVLYKNKNLFYVDYLSTNWQVFGRVQIPQGDIDFGKKNAINSRILAMGAQKYNNRGAVYLYDTQNLPNYALPATPVSAQWKQLQKLTSNNNALNGNYGKTLSTQGNTLVVGAPLEDKGVLTQTGAAYIYEQVGGTWALKQTLYAPTPTSGDRFGEAVSVEGNYLAIGAPGTKLIGSGLPYPSAPSTYIVTGTVYGQVYLYQRQAESWTFIRTINFLSPPISVYKYQGPPSPYWATNFGYKLKLNNGELWISSDEFFGTIYRARKVSDNWLVSIFSQGVRYDNPGDASVIVVSKITDFDVNNSRLIVSLEDQIWDYRLIDGNWVKEFEALAITPFVSVDQEDVTYVNDFYVNDKRVGLIQATQIHRLPLVNYGRLFNSLYVSGAPAGEQASVYVYRRNVNNINPEGKLIASDIPETDEFGSVIGGNATQIMIGVPKHDSNGVTDSGAVYIFTNQPSTPNTPTPTPTPITPTPPLSTCAANLLTNPNFSTDLSDWNRWDNTSSVVNGKLQIVGAGGIGQHKAASAGQAYTLKATSGSGGNATLGINFYDAGWNLLNRATTDAGGNNSPRTVQAPAPANTALVEAWVWNSSGTLSADDFCLTSNSGNATTTPTPTPTATSVGPSATPTLTSTPQPSTCTANALGNGGFESDFASWSRWDSSTSIGSDAKVGGKALRIGPSAGGIGQHVSVTAGANLSLSAWSKLANSGSGGRIGLTFFNSQWQQVGSNIYADVSSTGYTRHDLSATVPANASLAQVWAYKSGSGDQWLDDVCLQGASAAAGAPNARMVSPGRWVTTADNASHAVYLPLALRK